MKLTVVRPSVRFECPSTVDVGKTIALPVVLDAPAPPDGYRLRLYQTGMSAPGRSTSTHVEELGFAAGEARKLVELKVWNTDATPPPEHRGGLI